MEEKNRKSLPLTRDEISQISGGYNPEVEQYLLELQEKYNTHDPFELQNGLQTKSIKRFWSF